MEQQKNQNRNYLFIFLVFLIVTAFWISTKDIPYWWDSAGFIINAARYYIETNFNSFIFPSDSKFSAMAHPPLFPFLLALTWKIFGESLLVSHAFYYIFILLTGLFAFFLTKKIVDSEHDLVSSIIGILVVLVLFFTPVFLAQVGIIYVEIPAAAFALATVYFFLKRRPKLYFVSAFLMLFMKEVSVVIILAVLSTLILKFLKNYLKEKKPDFKKLVKELIIYGSPIILLVGWFVWHKIETGWLFAVPYYQEQFSENIFSFDARRFMIVFRFFFLKQWRLLVTLGVLLFLSFILLQKKERRILFSEKFLLLILIAIFVPFIFGKLEFLHRYIVFGLAFFYILFFYSFSFLLKERVKEEQITILAGTTIFLLLFYFSWNDHREIKNWHFPPLEENLEYQDVISIGKEMVEFIGKYYPDAVVWTGFPANIMLSQPFQHYGSKQIETRICKDYKEGDRVDIIVFDLLSPPQIDCLKIIQSQSFSPLIRFEKNGKWMEIYKAQNYE